MGSGTGLSSWLFPGRSRRDGDPRRLCADPPQVIATPPVAVNSSKKYVDLMYQDDYIRINREEESRPLDCDPVRSGYTGPPGRLYLPGGVVSARNAYPLVPPAADAPARASRAAR